MRNERDEGGQRKRREKGRWKGKEGMGRREKKVQRDRCRNGKQRKQNRKGKRWEGKKGWVMTGKDKRGEEGEKNRREYSGKGPLLHAIFHYQ